MKGGSSGSIVLIAFVRQVERATHLRQTWQSESSMCGMPLAPGEKFMVQFLIVEVRNALRPWSNPTRPPQKSRL